MDKRQSFLKAKCQLVVSPHWKQLSK